MPIPNQPLSLLERVWKRVRVGPACWEWTGSKVKGYGQIMVSPGHPDRVHRVVWKLSFGKVPKSMHVLHDCDNRACARPSHLWLGTNEDNHEDKIQKGRQARGSSLGTLTAAQVLDIRRLWELKVSGRSLAKRFGVSFANISLIVNRKSWTHI